MKIPDSEISAALDVIEELMEKVLIQVFGEKMGYAMLIREVYRGQGHCMLISNGAENRHIRALLQEGINQLDLEKTVN